MLKNLDGNEMRLADHRSQVVLVDFWATWCGPCKAELPHIQRIYEQHRDKGLVVLAISTDQQRDAVRLFVDENAYTFPVLFADGKVQPDYKVREIPAVYLIDREGTIRFHHVGYAPGGEKELEQQVEKLLEEKVGTTQMSEG